MENLSYEMLEKRVHEELIEQTAENAYKMMKNPSYEKAVRGFFKGTTDSIIAGMEELNQMDGGDEDVSEIYEMIESQMNAKVDEMFSNPIELRKLSYDSAKSFFLTKDELEKQVNELYSGMGTFLTPEIRECVEDLKEISSKYLEINKDYENRLVEIAREEGIENAMSKETRYRIQRDVFSTPEEYMNSKTYGFDIAKDLLKVLIDSLSESTDTEALVIGTMLKGAMYSADNFVDTLGKVYIDYFREECDEIWASE